MTDLIHSLKIGLANSYSLCLKAQNFHWNIEGKEFYQLHQLFEDFYQQLFLAVDELAERLRMLKIQAPASFNLYNQLRQITDSEQQLNATQMLNELISDYQLLINSLKSIIIEAKKLDDEATIGIITNQMINYEKNTWIINSLLN